MKKPKVSVIVAAYNVDAYIDKTMMSAVNQSLNDIEIICVDDGSTDDTNEILNSFAKEDNRIKVIKHDVNKGLSITRKDGVMASTGEYILFLDGDDYLDVRACEDLYEDITREKVDMFQFGTNVVVFEKYNKEELYEVERWITPYDGKRSFKYNGDFTNFCFVEKAFGWNMWNKIYNGDIVRKAFSYIGNNYINMAEDVYHTFLITFFAKSYASTNEKYYYYNWGAGMTGSKQLTNDFFEKKAERGKIFKPLETFTDKMDPGMITGDSIKAVKTQFINETVIDLALNNNLLDKNKILSVALQHYDKTDILCGLAESYYNGNYAIKKNIIKVCESSFKETATGSIKTIGMYYFRMENGSVERVISKLIPICIDMGYDVVLFTDEIASPRDYYYPETVKRVILPKIREYNKKEYKERFEYLSRMVKEHNVDALIYHAWNYPHLLFDMLAIKSAGSKFIVHTHNFFASSYGSIWADGVINDILLNYIYKLCDAIVAISEADYNWWATRFDNVYRTINPFSFDPSSVVPAKLDGANIVWVCRISPEKQPIDALKIMKKVVDSGCKATLHMVGGGDDKEYENTVVSEIEKMGLKEHVIMHGFQTDVSPFFSNASIYLHTAVFEGFPMSVMESKAYGLPAVMYDIPSLDVIKERKGMFVIEQGDIDTAAQKIIWLLKNDEERKAMGRVARESFESMYNFDIAGLWKSIFTDLEENRTPDIKRNDERLKTALSMMLDFTAAGIEERDKTARSSCNALALRELEYQRKLQEVESMRTWKMIQRYKNFMDSTTIGKALSKIRDLLFPRR
ncbi:MAG: glycosyltransferase [Lachnospiraceae bacterium]|nr:glycosyltransferase [Lachnospiraceae bacterium]